MIQASSPAHKQEIDVGQQQVAGIYARALVGATEAAGQTEAALDELDSFVNDVLAVFPQFEAILTSRLVAADEKAALLDRVLSGKAAPLVLNFVKVLAKHDRFDTLRAALQIARRHVDELRGRVEVEVITATPLAAELAEQIKTRMRGLVGGEPRLVPITDPNIIGGVVLRVGDTVYDGSVAAQLATVRERLINRSVHEIQSRRDRFSNPE